MSKAVDFVKPPHLPTLLLDTLLRPSRLAAFVKARADAVRWLALAAAQVLGVTVGLVVVLSLIIPVSPVGLVVGPGFGIALTLIGALPAFFSLPLELATQLRLAVALMRALIVTLPPTLIGTVIILSPAFPTLQRDPLVALLFLIVFGGWFGGALTVALLVSPRRHTPPTLRWLGVGGTFLIGGLIWWSEPLRRTEAVLLTPLLVGLGLGLLRPLSYLWAAPWSLGLALASRFGVPAQRLLAVHPVSLDELGLIPLPGLAALLVRACRADIMTGGPWLVQVAQHPSQGGAARRALDQLIRAGQGHRVLFWLSTEAQGATWLQQRCTAVAPPHPLIAAYAALAVVGEPAAWPTIIEAHRTTITSAANDPGGAALLALLEAGAHILVADRWLTAMVTLRRIPPPPNLAADPLWAALATIHTWSDGRLPALLPDRAQALATLWETLDPLDGWPAALLGAMAEHLVYLLLVEHRRGAWLV